MKIGIITFHWATNYGAILQAYALQQALTALGHDVDIINYKPTQYDDSFWSFIRYRKFLDIKSYLTNRKKEAKLVLFREKYLNQTKRYRTLKSLQSETNGYNALITGSDQVLNPSFLLHGEKGGSTAYFLDFGDAMARRYAYAASFGVTEYPLELCEKVKPLLQKFIAVTSRENTGKAIFNAMGVDKPQTVCDPTLLHAASFYDQLTDNAQLNAKNDISAYFLRGRDKHIASVLQELNAMHVTEQGLEEWINIIRNSKHFVTNSFHGMMFCLIYHIPFSIVLTSKDNIGMNDRFYTILEPLKLTHRIFSEEDFYASDITFSDNWENIEFRLNEMRVNGWNFLKKIN